MFCGMPAFAATEPAPFEKRSEYGSKPVSRSKTKEKSPPIGSFPLMPISELLSAFGARLQSGPLFCFWIRYEAPTAERGSNGTPLLCQPTPVATMPKTVMPCQVSWQLVVKKSSGPAHGRGATAEGVVTDGAFTGMSSAAHASKVYEPPTAARRNAPQKASFGMSEFPGDQDYTHRPTLPFLRRAPQIRLSLGAAREKISACSSTATPQI